LLFLALLRQYEKLPEPLLERLEHAEVSNVIERPGTAPVKILLIDDSPADAGLITSMLRRAWIGDVAISHVQCLEDALRQLPDPTRGCVLLDLYLSGTQGLDGLVRLNTAAPELPIIVLTAYLDETVGLDAVQKGAQDYLVKSNVDGQHLSRAVRYAMERKKAARASADIEQERLRALGQMASGIAHDFNNALTPIIGFTQVLLAHPDEKLDDRAGVLRYLRMINTAANDAASTVRRLREFYRAREADEVFQPVNLNRLIEQVILLTQPKWKDQPQAAGRTVRVETDLNQLPAVNANENELREGLTNLISNAVDAMPEGGMLTIRTRAEGLRSQAGEDRLIAPARVVLDVSDTGTGMDEETRRHCMEPFFTTKGARGTGLGLPTLHGIVRRHEGTIGISSEVGKGTTFRIRLPVRVDAVVASDEQPSEERSRKLHVLVADDEEIVCETIVAYLTEDGHLVESASNGLEGLEKFLASWFDIVVTDRGMPEMSGDQFAVAIKKIAPNKPILMITGFNERIRATEERPDGVDYVLSKPVTIAALRQALDQLIQATERGRRLLPGRRNADPAA